MASSWYDDNETVAGKKGWYGYEKYPEKPKKKEKKEAQEKKETIAWPSASELRKMPPADIKKWFQKASDKALQQPSEQNVLRWSQYRQIILEKSVEFASAVQVVGLKHPETLTPAANIEFAGPGKKAIKKAMFQEYNNYLKREKDNFALLLFVSDRAPLSKPALKIAKTFARETGWELRVLDAESNKILAKSMNVQVLPTAILLARRGGYMPVMVGWSSVSELKKRVYKMTKILKGDESITDFGKSVIPGTVQFN